MLPTNLVGLAFLLCGLLSSFSAARRTCFMQDWSFEKKGEARCDYSNGYHYLVGFERDGTDNLKGLKKGKCCARDQTFWNTPTQCQYPDWVRTMDGTRTSTCPQGFFLRGLWRGDSNSIGSVDWGICCKPSHHPYLWKDCYDEDVSNTFNKAGVSECKREGNYFITGFHTVSSGGKLSSIRKFKCCKMWHEIKQLTSLDELKQRVMDTTMSYLGILAGWMGFAWAGGCWSYKTGEDFRKKGDTWESTYRSDNCVLKGGPKKDVRLKITYENFAYTMKDVTFGESIKPPITLEQEQQLINSPDRSYSKIAKNNKTNTGGSSEVEIQMRVASTLKNVQRSSWDSKFGIEAGMSYEPPTASGGAGFSAKTSFTYSWGGDEEDATVDEDWHILKVKEKKKLPPKTFAEWHAFKKPQTVTIPYTATVVPTFSVKLEGYMKWGDGYYGKTTNFHQEHRGSGDRKTVEHTFGSAKKPFYEALKEQSEQNMYPWQWHALKQRHPYAQSYIDELTNKDLYAFTMIGQFEETTENEIKSYWKPSRPIEEMADAMANLTAQADQAETFPGLPRIFPPPPEVKIIDNSKEINIPLVKEYDDNDEGEPEPTIFPRIHPPAPKVKPIDNSKEMKLPPVETPDENE
ncbi:hypothetical protein ACROYT_G033504 [Oculina patagonica]